jgi:hypothetical protein
LCSVCKRAASSVSARAWASARAASASALAGELPFGGRGVGDQLFGCGVGLVPLAMCGGQCPLLTFRATPFGGGLGAGRGTLLVGFGDDGGDLGLVASRSARTAKASARARRPSVALPTETIALVVVPRAPASRSAAELGDGRHGGLDGRVASEVTPPAPSGGEGLQQSAALLRA